jgi:hypothetical protein
MDRQIVLLKSLGINYPESGYLFEQCINTVFMMIEKKKEEVSWDEVSKILVQSKKRFPLQKGDISIMVVDIPKAIELLKENYFLIPK